MPAKPRPRRDRNEKAALLVAKATGTKLPKGEDLLGSEEAKKELRKAKRGPERK